MSTTYKPIDLVHVMMMRTEWRRIVDEVEENNTDLPRDEVLFIAALLILERSQGRA